MKRKKNTRNGAVADIVRLDFHDFFGNLIDRIKGKVTEKNKGIIMMEKIENNFGITKMDKIKFREDMTKYQIDLIKESNIPKELGKKESIKWTRDEKGNIISPYRSKKIV